MSDSEDSGDEVQEPASEAEAKSLLTRMSLQRTELLERFYSAVPKWAHRDKTTGPFEYVVFLTGEILGNVPKAAAVRGPEYDLAFASEKEKETTTIVALYGENERRQSVSVLVKGWQCWFRLKGTVTVLEPTLREIGVFFDRIESEGRFSTFYGFRPSADPMVNASAEYCRVSFRTIFAYRMGLQAVRHAGLTPVDTVQSPLDRFCADMDMMFGVTYRSTIQFSGPEVEPRWSHSQYETSDAVFLQSKLTLTPFQFFPRTLAASFDAEMTSYSRRFPEFMNGDHTICVAVQAFDSSRILQKYLLFVGDCDPVPETEVYCFATVVDLYEAFRYLVTVVIDATVITGWNCFGFDWPYAAGEVVQGTMKVHPDTHAVSKFIPKKSWVPPDDLRAFPYFKEPKDFANGMVSKALGTALTPDFEHAGPAVIPMYYTLPPARVDGASTFWFFGRRRLAFSKTITSKAEKGQRRKMYWVKADGRLSFDMMIWLRANPAWKMEENTLKYAATRFLDKDAYKIDMPPSEIFATYPKSPEARAKIGTYCVRDAEIPAKIAIKNKALSFFVQLAKVTHLSIEFLAHYGTMRQVLCPLIWKARDLRIVLNYDETVPALRDVDGTFEGATVVHPEPQLVSEPVLAFDYQQLYPSIMMAFGVSPNRWIISGEVPESLVGHVDEYSIEINGVPRRFVLVHEDPTRPEARGIFSLVLEDLTKARRAAKDLMERSSGFEREVADSEQQSLKVVSNTAYGFMSASLEIGSLPWVPGGAIVTYRGRTVLADTRKFIEDTYGATVVYGDTDSLMFTLPGRQSREALVPIGHEMAAAITARLPKPMKMNFEAIHTMLVLKPKMYATNTWEVTDTGLKPPKFKFKGLAVVRRDRPRILRDTTRRCLEAILTSGSFEPAVAILREVADMFCGPKELPRAIFEQTCMLRDLAEVVVDTAASAAYRRLLPLGDPRTPSTGTRVSIIVNRPPRIQKDSKVTDRSEICLGPSDAPAPNVDLVYYLEKIFETVSQYIVGNPGVTATISRILKHSVDTIVARKYLGIKRPIDSFFAPSKVQKT